MKELTIAIPAYNSAAFIEKGLNSYVYEDGTMDPRLELIIVNDGSTDDTAAIGRKWVERFPDNIKLIDKENGGHGSGINAGLDAAGGRYYKVIDSDDWIQTQNLKTVLDYVEDTEVDVVVTGFRTINIASGVDLAYGTGQQPAPKSEDVAQYGEAYAGLRCFGARGCYIGEMMEDVNNIPAVQSFHGIMYNTEFFRNTGIRMSENLYFEDQEYAIMPFAYVETVLLLPEFFYEYQIGSANQSVSFANQAKRADQFLQVVHKLVDFHKSHEMTEAQNDFLSWRIANAVTSYYAIVLVKKPEKKEGMELARAFHEYIHNEEPEIAERTEKKYKSMSKLNKIPGVINAYGKLFDSKAFAPFKTRWMR